MTEGHDAWLKKFNKTKQGKLFNLTYEVKAFKANLKPYDKLSHLSLALSIATKGTKMENDAKELIKLICPEYYSDEDENDSN